MTSFTPEAVDVKVVAEPTNVWLCLSVVHVPMGSKRAWWTPECEASRGVSGPNSLSGYSTLSWSLPGGAGVLGTGLHYGKVGPSEPSYAKIAAGKFVALDMSLSAHLLHDGPKKTSTLVASYMLRAWQWDMVYSLSVGGDV